MKNKVKKALIIFFKGLWKVLRSFIFKGDDPQPVYIYVMILMYFVYRMLYLHIEGIRQFRVELILGICGFILGWLSIFNWNTKIKNGFNKVKEKIKDKISERKAQI